ncbi:MAG: phosphatase PAP2 family protein [Firmicutes bacterium]|nr:phosphatase PAP2 family protein [Bacillota bacterium]
MSEKARAKRGRPQPGARPPALRAAAWVSAVFNPYTDLTLWLAASAWLAPAGRRAALAAWLAAVLLPLSVLAAGRRRGWWSHPDLVDRGERSLFLPVAWAGSGLAWLAARRWAPGSWLPDGFAVVLAWLAGVWLVTLRWKISLHTGAIGATTGGLAFFFAQAGQPRAALLALAVGTLLGAAVAWSRLRLGRHTPAQVVAGFLFGLACAGALLARTLPPPP